MAALGSAFLLWQVCMVPSSSSRCASGAFPIWQALHTCFHGPNCKQGAACLVGKVMAPGITVEVPLRRRRRQVYGFSVP